MGKQRKSVDVAWARSSRGQIRRTSCRWKMRKSQHVMGLQEGRRLAACPHWATWTKLELANGECPPFHVGMSKRARSEGPSHGKARNARRKACGKKKQARGRSLVRAAWSRDRPEAWCGPNRGKRRERPGQQAWASPGSWLAAAGPVAWAAGPVAWAAGLGCWFGPHPRLFQVKI